MEQSIKLAYILDTLIMHHSAVSVDISEYLKRNISRPNVNAWALFSRLCCWWARPMEVNILPLAILPLPDSCLFWVLRNRKSISAKKRRPLFVVVQFYTSTDSWHVTHLKAGTAKTLLTSGIFNKLNLLKKLLSLFPSWYVYHSCILAKSAAPVSFSLNL